MDSNFLSLFQQTLCEIAWILSSSATPGKVLAMYALTIHDRYQQSVLQSLGDDQHS